LQTLSCVHGENDAERAAKVSVSLRTGRANSLTSAPGMQMLPVCGQSNV
jgi:hypothetical protein